MVVGWALMLLDAFLRSEVGEGKLLQLLEILEAAGQCFVSIF